MSGTHITITMPKDTYWPRRFRRHLVLAAAAFAIVCLAYAATPPSDVRHRMSLATAYAGLFLLAVSLWLGPWNVLRRRPNPTSFDLRRDVGIWTGILAIVHNGDRLDGPSLWKDVDVLFPSAASTSSAKYAIRFRQFYRACGCATLPDALSHL